MGGAAQLAAVSRQHTDLSKELPAFTMFMEGVRSLRGLITQSRIWRWWSLENWKDAADVAVKFAAILGAVAATNFFVLRPQLNSTVRYCLILDLELLRSRYAALGLEPPDPLTGMGDSLSCQNGSLPANRISVLPVGLLSPEDYAAAPAGGFDLFGLLVAESQPAPEVEALYREHYELTGEEWDDDWLSAIPVIGRRILAISEELTVQQLQTGLALADESLGYRATVTLSNDGQAIARGVQVTAPAGWSAEAQSASPFDLPVGAFRDLTYTAGEHAARASTPFLGPWQSGNVFDLFTGQSSADAGPRFLITSESSQVLDTSTLSRVGFGLLALWLAIVMKDVISLKPTRSTSRGYFE